MKINQIIKETTTSGAVSTLAQPMMTQTRGQSVYGNTKAGSLLKGKKTNKPYANSLSEGKMNQLSLDLKGGVDGLTDVDFKKKYGKTKAEARKELQRKPEPQKKPETMSEADLHEEDKILAVGKGKKLKTGLHGKSEKPKFRGFLPPFKSQGMYVSDKRGNSVCECNDSDLAPTIAKALNAYAIANESIQRSAGVGEEKINEKFKSKQQAKLMFAVAGDKDVSKKTGVSQKVAKEFVKKSHGQKVSKLPAKIKKKE